MPASRRIPIVALLLNLLLGGFFLLAAPPARSQTRVNDRDLEAIMRNLHNDTKKFQSKFDNDIRKKSIIRNTSQAKDAIKLMATFVRQTNELPKRFKKDRNGGDSFHVVQSTAEQLDATVNSAHLSQPVKDHWRNIRAEVDQIAAAYNMSLPFTQGSNYAAKPAPIYEDYSGIYGHQTSRRAHQTWLCISVFANVPVESADIAVYDLNGKRIFEKRAATNNRGVYAAPITHLPQDFRVTAISDGTRLLGPGLPSMGRFTLSADVRGFDPDSAIVYINPVTTLAADVADKLPGHDLNRAQDLVRRFLVLPPHASLGAAMRQGPYYQSPYFSETRFLTQAQRDGGMDRFVNDLTSRALRSSPPDSFASTRTTHLAVAKFIGTNLASGALSWLGGQGIGWAVSSGNKPEPGATKKDIEQLQDKLADLQSSVDNLSGQLTALSDQIMAQLTTGRYETYVVPALSISSLVDTVEEELSFYVQDCPPISEEADSALRGQQPECVELKSRIGRKLEDNRIGSAFQDLSNFMLPNGRGGSTGMVRLYSESLASRQRFFRPADSTTMQDMFDYWYAVQVQAANLRVEDWHFAGRQNSDGGRKQLQGFLGYEDANPPKPGKLQNTLDAEEELTYPPVPLNTVINTRDRTMWVTNYPDRTTRPDCHPEEVPNGILLPSASRFPVTVPQVAYANFGPLKGLFASPTENQAKALILGWTGKNANEWLIQHTRSVAPEIPVQRGFTNIVALNGNGCTTFPAMWLRNHNVLNLDDGVISSERRLWDWLFAVRELEPGEQYYWYSGQ